MALKGNFWPFLAIFGHIGGLWHPPEAFLDPGKGPNTLPQMCPGQIIFDQPFWSLQGDFCLQKVFLIFFAIFGHFWPL